MKLVLPPPRGRSRTARPMKSQRTLSALMAQKHWTERYRRYLKSERVATCAVISWVALSEIVPAVFNFAFLSFNVLFVAFSAVAALCGLAVTAKVKRCRDHL